MTSLNYCPKDIGEDYPDDECKNAKGIDTKCHSHYFNPDTKFSDRCDY